MGGILERYLERAPASQPGRGASAPDGGILARYADDTPPPPDEGAVQRAVGAAAEARLGAWRAALARGLAETIESTGTLGEVAGRLTGIDAVRNAGTSVRGAGAALSRGLGTPTAPQRLEDIRLTEDGGLGRAGAYVRETVGTLGGQLAPELALMAATGGASAVLGAGGRAALARGATIAATGLSRSAQAAALARRAVQAAPLTIAQSIGETRIGLEDAARSQGVALDEADADRTSVLLGVPAGLLDSALPGRVGGELASAGRRAFGLAERVALAEAVQRGGLVPAIGRTLREGVVSGATEFGTEVAQTALTNIAAPALTGLDTPEAWASMLVNAGVAGAIGGGAFGGGARAISESVGAWRDRRAPSGDAAASPGLAGETPEIAETRNPATPAPTNSAAPSSSPAVDPAARRAAIEATLASPEAAGLEPDERAALEAELTTLPVVSPEAPIVSPEAPTVSPSAPAVSPEAPLAPESVPTFDEGAEAAAVPDRPVVPVRDGRGRLRSDAILTQARPDDLADELLSLLEANGADEVAAANTRRPRAQGDSEGDWAPVSVGTQGTMRAAGRVAQRAKSIARVEAALTAQGVAPEAVPVLLEQAAQRASARAATEAEATRAAATDAQDMTPEELDALAADADGMLTDDGELVDPETGAVLFEPRASPAARLLSLTDPGAPQGDLFADPAEPLPTIARPAAGATATQRAAWAIVQNPRERRAAEQGRLSLAFLDAFAALRGEQAALPEEVALRRQAEGGARTFTTDDTAQQSMFEPASLPLSSDPDEIASWGAPALQPDTAPPAPAGWGGVDGGVQPVAWSDADLPPKDDPAAPDEAQQRTRREAVRQRVLQAYRGLIWRITGGYFTEFASGSRQRGTRLRTSDATPNRVDLQAGMAEGLAGTRVLGFSLDFFSALLQDRGLKLEGQVIRDPGDLAVLAQALRDPTVESGRLIAVDGDGRIISHEVTSLNEVGETFVIPLYLADKLKNAAPQNRRAALQAVYPGAQGFYLVHNHPSGSPVPSDADLQTTHNLGQLFDGLLLGHVIINSGQYAFLPPDVSPTAAAFSDRTQYIRDLPNAPAQDPLLTPGDGFAGEGATAAGTDVGTAWGRSVALAAKAAYRPGVVTVIGMTRGAVTRLRVVSDPPRLQNGAARNLDQVREVLEDVRRATGADNFALVTDDPAVRQAIENDARNIASRVSSVVVIDPATGQVRATVPVIAPDRPTQRAPEEFVAREDRQGNGGRTLRTAIDTLMQSRWVQGTLDALLRRTRVASDALVTFDPDVEQRYTNSKGVAPGWRARIRASWEWMRAQREAIPALGRPSRDGMTAAVNDLLLQLRRVPAYAQRLAGDVLVEVTQGLSRAEVDLMTRQLVLDDLLKDLDAGRYTLDGTPVPFFGRDAQGNVLAPSAARVRIEAAMAEVQGAIGNRPAVAQALVRRRERVRAVVQALVEAKLLPASVLADERYYHRQVLEYARAIEAGSLKPGTRGARTATSGFQRQRRGGGEFNTLYAEAEFEWLAQSFEKLATVDIQQRVKAIADQAPAYRRQAQAENRRRFYERVTPLVEQWARGETDGLPAALLEALGDPPAQVDLGAGVFGTEADPLRSFRARIAMNTQGVLRAITGGTMPTASLVPFAGLLQAAERWQQDGAQGPFAHDQWWAFLSALAADETLPGSTEARGIFAAIQQRNALIAEVLGGAEVSWRDMLADDVQVWQPKPGVHTFRAVTIPEDVMEEVLARQRDLVREDLREVLAMGGPKEEWAVPAHIAAALDDPTAGLGTLGRYSLEKQWMRGLGMWKFWQLYRPDRLLKYNLNNAAGDLDVTFTHPGVLRFAGQALRDLRTEASGVAGMPAALKAELREWLRHGAIDSGFLGGEIQAVWGMPELDRLMAPNPLAVMRFLGAYWSKAEGLTRIRENTLRLAAARYFRDAIQRTGRIPGFAASNPKIIRGLWEQTDPAERATVVAARLARDLIGDYQSVSAGGSWARNRLMPFFSWQEINVKRYWWLVRNVAREQDGGLGVVGGVARVAAAAGVRGATATALKAASLGLAVHAFYAAAMLWNRLMFPDEEESLRREGRGLHVIYGTEEDGTIKAVRLESAWAAALKLFGLEDWPSDVKDLRDGRKDLQQLATETLQAPVKFVVNGWEPVTKGLFEWGAGVSFFPDPFKPRPIKEPGREWLRNQGLEWTNDVYRTVMGEPIPPSRPGPLAAPPGQVVGRVVDQLIGYRIDAGESAYWFVRQRAQDFLEKQEGTGRGAARLGERDLALYYFRAAARWGDDAKADEWLARYYQLGGTPELMRRALTNQDPLDALPSKYQGRFLRSLSADERAAFDAARAWWRERRRAGLRAARGVSVSAARRAAREAASADE
jgi:proteasome lid subunit RPN8/RPN11